jgi:helicase required for RNAi-mediated heterochromatin assembly 1
MRAPSPITEHSGSSVDKWKAYATGGAEADDAKYIQQLQEEDAKYREQLANGTKDPSPPRLIEMSPAKQPANENLAAVNHLLVDLDMGATEPSSQSVSGTAYASIASTSVNKKKGKSQRSNLNLMD